MKILILGGTQFIGRHITEALLKAGHKVSIFNRGISHDTLPEAVGRFRGDRNNGMRALEELTERTWDVCVDVSGYTPTQVKASAEKLVGKIGRYIFISAVSVYGDPDNSPVLETHPRIKPAGEDITEINSETYGALKVACEDIIQQFYADRFTILRPQIVAGPYDPYDRFSYWVKRSVSGGEMLAPGDGFDYLQFIDVFDIAQFVKTVIEKDISGIFNLAGTRITWMEFMKILGPKNIVWVSSEIIRSERLTYVEVPLYRKNGEARSSLMNVSNKLAVDAGLKLSDLKRTVNKTKKWIRGKNISPALSYQVESYLIQLSRKVL